MRRKIMTVLTLGTLASLALSGCGAGKANDTKLTVWTNMSVEADTIQKYADEWAEANGYEVEIVHQSPSVQQFAQAVNSPDGPEAAVGITNDQLSD